MKGSCCDLDGPADADPGLQKGLCAHVLELRGALVLDSTGPLARRGGACVRLRLQPAPRRAGLAG